MTERGKKIKPSINEKELGVNPLVSGDFKIVVNLKTDLGKHVKSDEGYWVPDEFELEREGVTKVYNKSENRIWANDMSAPARLIFLWIIYELDIAKDYLWINKGRLMKECGISSYNTYKKGIQELAKKMVICPMTIKDVYWINPRLIFNGNRAAKYPDAVKRHVSEKKDNGIIEHNVKVGE